MQRFTLVFNDLIIIHQPQPVRVWRQNTTTSSSVLVVLVLVTCFLIRLGILSNIHWITSPWSTPAHSTNPSLRTGGFLSDISSICTISLGLFITGVPNELTTRCNLHAIYTVYSVAPSTPAHTTLFCRHLVYRLLLWWETNSTNRDNMRARTRQNDTQDTNTHCWTNGRRQKTRRLNCKVERLSTFTTRMFEDCANVKTCILLYISE